MSRLSFVVPFNGSPIHYGWNSQTDDADGQILGHKTKEQLQGIGVLGANRPKPARMVRRRATGDTSGFVDHTAIDAAEAAGWKISKPGKYGPVSRTSNKSVLVAAEVATGIDVCWSMTKRQFDAIGGDRTGLGIRVIGQSKANKAVTGVSKWFNTTAPVGAYKLLGDGKSLSVGYVDKSKLGNLPDGWSASSDNIAADPRFAPTSGG